MEKERLLKELSTEIKYDLGIRDDFLVEVKLGWGKPFEYCCICIPLASGYKGLYGVEIKINEEHSLEEAILHLLHEMHHAKQYSENKNPRFAEIRADFYALRKFLKFYRMAKKMAREFGFKL